jgi:hypothetical protein
MVAAETATRAGDTGQTAPLPTASRHRPHREKDGGDMEERKFAAGQNVVMKQSAFHRAPTDTFEIVRLLPAERGNPQYRIKSLRDGHERVVMESDLA